MSMLWVDHWSWTITRSLCPPSGTPVTVAQRPASRAWTPWGHPWDGRRLWMTLISGSRWTWVNLWSSAEWPPWGVSLGRSGSHPTTSCIGWTRRRTSIRSLTEMSRSRRHFYMLKFPAHLNTYKIFLKNEIFFTCIVNFFFNFENHSRYTFLNLIKKYWKDEMILSVNYFIQWNSLSPEFLILRKSGLKVKFIILSFISQTIPGNVNNNETATYFFKSQFQARYLKLKPVTFSGGISLRLDILVCQHGRESPTHLSCNCVHYVQFIIATTIKVDR